MSTPRSLALQGALLRWKLGGEQDQQRSFTRARANVPRGTLVSIGPRTWEFTRLGPLVASLRWLKLPFNSFCCLAMTKELAHPGFDAYDAHTVDTWPAVGEGQQPCIHGVRLTCHTYVRTYVHTYIQLYTHVDITVRVCIYVHKHIYIYIFTYTDAYTLLRSSG